MSIITTINSTDNITDSRAVINTNFSNLNTDKQETSGKDATGGYAGLTLFKINFKNAANTFTNFFTNATTAARTYTFQDRNGTIADDTDLALKAPIASPTFTGTVALGTSPTMTTPVITGLPTGTGVASAPTVSTLASRDVSGNIYGAHVSGGFRTQATAASTLTLVLADAEFQIFTGSTASQIVKLPDVTTGATSGYKFFIDNDSTVSIDVQASDASALVTLLAKQSVELTMISAGATNASWDVAVIAGLDAVNNWSVAQQFSTIELGHASDTTLSRVSAGVIAVEGVTIDTVSATNTLTNKRITKRVLSAASYTTDTGTSLNCDNLDEFIVTAQAGALKLNNPTGTPTDGQVLFVAVTGTAARALTYDTQFEASTVALPTTTVTTARLNMIFIWRADTSKWVILGAV